MTRKQGKTARESNTSSSPFSPLTESNSNSPDPYPSGPTRFETRPAMTRQTSMARLPLPPPVLSWAAPLPEYVQIDADVDPFPPPPPQQSPTSMMTPADVVGPRHRNLIISFPSALHRAALPDPARTLTLSLNSSNRATVRGMFWILNTISTRPEKPLGLHRVWNMISTTFRDGWPAGSSEREGKKEDESSGPAFMGADRVRLTRMCWGEESGSGLAFADSDRLGREEGRRLWGWRLRLG